MKFPAYPKYKASGVEWLGDVPEHWDLLPFTKYVAEKSDYRGKTPEKQPNGVFLVTARNVRMGFIDYESSQEFVAEEDYDEIMRRGLPKKGDILFTTEAPLGNMAIVDREDVALAQRIIRFRMNRARFDSQFTLFAMMSDYFQLQLQSLSTGSTAEGLKASKLPILRLIAPPHSEQQAIAEFLDRETGRIDRLVAKKRELIERLKEKRTALISRTVTRGLPPAAARAAGLPENPPLKPSGLDWLGDIPAHWDVKRLKRFFRLIYRYPTYYDIQYVDEGIPEIRGEALVDGEIVPLEDQRFISPETNSRFPKTILDIGDIVMSVRGTMGKVGVVRPNFKGGNITANLLRLSPNQRQATPGFLSWLFRSSFFEQALDRVCPQTTIQTVTMPQLTALELPHPPVPEQTAIAAYLDAETAKLDALVAKVETAIGQLQEYRTALITAAVTGKIDVREVRK